MDSPGARNATGAPPCPSMHAACPHAWATPLAHCPALPPIPTAVAVVGPGAAVMVRNADKLFDLMRKCIARAEGALERAGESTSVTGAHVPALAPASSAAVTGAHVPTLAPASSAARPAPGPLLTPDATTATTALRVDITPPPAAVPAAVPRDSATPPPAAVLATPRGSITTGRTGSSSPLQSPAVSVATPGAASQGPAPSPAGPAGPAGTRPARGSIDALSVRSDSGSSSVSGGTGAGAGLGRDVIASEEEEQMALEPVLAAQRKNEALRRHYETQKKTLTPKERALVVRLPSGSHRPAPWQQ